MAYWFTRYVVGGGRLGSLGLGQQNEKLCVLTQTPIGKDQRLAVIQAGKRYFIVGITPQNITLISELTSEEAQPWLKDSMQEGTVVLTGFQQVLIQSWQKRKRGEEQ